MLDISLTPTLLLGAGLFILLILVARTWLLQDVQDRRDRRDRRQLDERPAFPFYDGAGYWVTRDRRTRPDRRKTHTFISEQDFHQS